MANADDRDRVFINYRNDDEPFGAALIDQAMAAYFGTGRVFRAARSIPAGDDYVEALLGALRRSAVVLAIIGPRWATTEMGRERVLHPDDWVRRELAEAFRQRIRVIPVLLNAPPPQPFMLPPDIAALARCQYIRVHHRYLARDIAHLITSLTTLVPSLTATAVRSA